MPDRFLSPATESIIFERTNLSSAKDMNFTLIGMPTNPTADKKKTSDNTVVKEITVNALVNCAKLDCDNNQQPLPLRCLQDGNERSFNQP